MVKPLHIAIDASRSTVARLTGTEHYSLELLRHLILINEEREEPHHLHLYFRDAPTEDLLPDSPHVHQQIVPFPRLWTHLRFAQALWRQRPDVSFVPAHTLPLVFPGKAVVTIHDLGYRHFPQAHPPIQRRYLDWTTRYSAARATLVLADSQATAADLQHFYGTAAQKIRVVYPGVQAPQRGDRYRLFDRYGLPLRYFLFIGTLQPRKNIQRIVQAFDIWQQANQEREIGLVLAGKPGWLYDPSWIQDVPNVYLTGYIADEDKGTLISNALALLFPSLHEGFGFPVLEAMHLSTPVITSNTSSLPELASDAAVLVNPLNVYEIAAALDVLMSNDGLRKQLMFKGLQQARRFTWEQAAEQCLQALEEAAQK